MYPTLSHLIEDLFGIYIPLPFQTYGFFLVIALFVAAWVLHNELKRKQQDGRIPPREKQVWVEKAPNIFLILGNGLVAFALGYKFIGSLLNYSEFVASPENYLFSATGSWWGGALLALPVMFFYYREKQKQRLPEARLETQKIYAYKQVGTLLVLAAISGLVGAKVFHILENFSLFLSNPLSMLLSGQGMTFYGGLIFGAVALISYARWAKIPVVHLADATAPALAIGYGLGRVACQMSGDGCWGIENPNPKPGWLNFLPDWAWAFDYPQNVIKRGISIDGCSGDFCRVLETPVYPTPIYETTMMLLIFALLWSVRKRIRVPGVLFSLYLILSGIERFLIEKIRVNNVYALFGLEITQAEIISLVSVFLGIAGIFYFRRKAQTGSPPN